VGESCSSDRGSSVDFGGGSSLSLDSPAMADESASDQLGCCKGMS
jgi:hypothetical protein